MNRRYIWCKTFCSKKINTLYTFSSRFLEPYFLEGHSILCDISFEVFSVPILLTFQGSFGLGQSYGPGGATVASSVTR